MSDVWFGAGLLVVCLLTLGLTRWAGAGLGWLPVVALARAAVQLSVVAALLHGVLNAPLTVGAFIALMLTTASWTAGRRTQGLWHGRRIAVVGVLGGSVVAIGVVIALQLAQTDARHLVAISGIVIGGTMSASTLAGRRFLHSAAARRDEVEGWLALGATGPQAHLDIGRIAVRESVLPNLDQTKSTGLVTLPGAFVGALFGGASPVDAARFQLVVLAALGLAMTVAAILVTRLAARTPYVVVGESS
ncbi:ABC transporter permease [Nocardioides sp. AN3]